MTSSVLLECGVLEGSENRGSIPLVALGGQSGAGIFVDIFPARAHRTFLQLSEKSTPKIRVRFLYNGTKDL
jgi:hypothetical protein